MFKLFSKNFLNDLWANLQILASIDDFQSNEVIIESKSGILIDALLKINYPKIKNKKVLNINDFLEDSPALSACSASLTFTWSTISPFTELIKFDISFL